MQIISTNPTDIPWAPVLCVLRFFGNALRFDDLAKALLVHVNPTLLWESLATQAGNANKSVRLAVATLLLNLSLTLSQPHRIATIGGADMVTSHYGGLITTAASAAKRESESADVVLRCATAIGTAVMLGGLDVKTIAYSADVPSLMHTLTASWASKIGTGAACLSETLSLFQ
jgi:hypothetical protein